MWICIVSCNKPVIFSPVYKSLHAGKICFGKTVCCSISTKPVSALISSEPVKSFVISKPVCFSNVTFAKEFNSVNYCLVTCTEHPVNVNSSVVKKSAVSYRTACPVDFDITVETINVTLLCTYRCVSFKIPHHITPPVISIWNFHYIEQGHLQHSQFAQHHHQLHHHLSHQNISSQKYHPH